MGKKSELKNRDMPAMPCLGYTRRASGDITPDPCIYDGLTKFEMFAGMAMQGILANPSGLEMSVAKMKSHAFLCANAMLNEPKRP